MGDTHLYDEHGSIDLGKELFDDVKFDTAHHLQGATLNVLLKGQFMLHSMAYDNSNALPGGAVCWDDITEVLYVTLLSNVSLTPILNRTSYLLRTEDTEVVNRMKHGAMQFFSVWINYFEEYLMTCQLEEMHTSFSSVISDVDETSLRSKLSALTSLISLQLTRRKRVQFMSPVALYINNTRGMWKPSPDEVPKKRQLKSKSSAATSTPQPTIAVFGVTPDVLDEDDDDRDPWLRDASPVVSDDEASIQSSGLPEPRLPVNMQLLQDPRNIKYTDLDLIEVARQWTLIDFSLFRSIAMWSYYQCGWTAPRHQMIASDIRRVMDRFNAQSHWVCTEILHGETAKDRAETYVVFVKLATILEALNNFSGVMAIVTALQQSCITRLTATLQLVDSSTKSCLSTLQTLMSSTKNYSRYREELSRRAAVMISDTDTWEGRLQSRVKKTKSMRLQRLSVSSNAQASLGASAIMPHLSAHLSELCGIEEGNTMYVVDAPHLINLDKLRLVSRCLLFLRQLQRLNYSLVPVRLVSCVLNAALKESVFISSTDASSAAKDLYEISQNKEGSKSSTTSVAATSTGIAGRRYRSATVGSASSGTRPPLTNITTASIPAAPVTPAMVPQISASSASNTGTVPRGSSIVSKPSPSVNKSTRHSIL